MICLKGRLCLGQACVALVTRQRSETSAISVTDTAAGRSSQCVCCARSFRAIPNRYLCLACSRLSNAEVDGAVSEVTRAAQDLESFFVKQQQDLRDVESEDRLRAVSLSMPILAGHFTSNRKKHILKSGIFKMIFFFILSFFFKIFRISKTHTHTICIEIETGPKNATFEFVNFSKMWTFFIFENCFFISFFFFFKPILLFCKKNWCVNFVIESSQRVRFSLNFGVR